MHGPGVAHQQPHQQRDGQRVTDVIKKSDRQEAKNERLCAAPEPEVLMQQVKDNDGYGQSKLFHLVCLFCLFASNLLVCLETRLARATYYPTAITQIATLPGQLLECFSLAEARVSLVSTNLVPNQEFTHRSSRKNSVMFRPIAVVLFSLLLLCASAASAQTTSGITGT